jgi:hypothetical protein
MIWPSTGSCTPAGRPPGGLLDLVQERLGDPELGPTTSNPFCRADGNPWPFVLNAKSAPAPAPVNRRPVTIPPLTPPAGNKPTVIGRAVIPPGGSAGPNQNLTVPPFPSPRRKPEEPTPDAKPESSKPNASLNPNWAGEVAKRESGGERNGGLGAINTIKDKDGKIIDRALGKYQMRNKALIDAGYKRHDGSWTGKGGINSDKDFLSSSDAQNDALGAFTGKLWGQLDDARGNVGGTITGIKGEITVTKSGLIAAAHRRGAARVKDYFNRLSKNGGDSKANYQNLDPRLAKQFRQIETRLREFQAAPYE